MRKLTTEGTGESLPECKVVLELGNHKQQATMRPHLCAFWLLPSCLGTLISLFLVGCASISDEMPWRPGVNIIGIWLPWLVVSAVLIPLVFVAFILGRRRIQVRILRFLLVVYLAYLSYSAASFWIAGSAVAKLSFSLESVYGSTDKMGDRSEAQATKDAIRDLRAKLEVGIQGFLQGPKVEVEKITIIWIVAFVIVALAFCRRGSHGELLSARQTMRLLASSIPAPLVLRIAFRHMGTYKSSELGHVLSSKIVLRICKSVYGEEKIMSQWRSWVMVYHERLIAFNEEFSQMCNTFNKYTDRLNDNLEEAING